LRERRIEFQHSDPTANRNRLKLNHQRAPNPTTLHGWKHANPAHPRPSWRYLLQPTKRDDAPINLPNKERATLRQVAVLDVEQIVIPGPNLKPKLRRRFAKRGPHPVTVGSRVPPETNSSRSHSVHLPLIPPADLVE
jgi:hypothetical protein